MVKRIILDNRVGKPFGDPLAGRRHGDGCTCRSCVQRLENLDRSKPPRLADVAKQKPSRDLNGKFVKKGPWR